MYEDILKNNPALAGIDPAKLEFLLSFAQMEKPKNMNKAMPFLMMQMKLARQKNLNFSKGEITLISELLSKDLPPEEKEKVRKMMEIVEKMS